MGRKMRMCSRKYRDWKKKSPKKANSKGRSPKKAVKRSPTKAMPTISSLYKAIELPQSWYDHTQPNLDSIRLCKVTDTASSSSQPLVVTHTIIINSNLTWKLFVHNREVQKCSALSCIPFKLDAASMNKILQLVNKLNICSGHPETKFVTFVDHKKGKLHNKTGNIAAFVNHLRVLQDRWSNRSDELSSSSSHANNRYLNTPEKQAKFVSL